MQTIILCGGSGTRLWPLSRKMYPKQFVPLIQRRTLFELTVERNWSNSDRFMVITNEKLDHFVYDQMPSNGEVSLILEPVARDTAPAIALASMQADPEETLLVVPSDHNIRDQQAYEEAVEKAENLAREGGIVTFGIQPESPETGYGYIRADGNDVLEFKEKPDFETAKWYLQQGNYYWNGGMFCFKAGAFLEELKHHQPEMYEACRQTWENADKTNGNFRPREMDMNQIPALSVDYAVMEKSEQVKVVPCSIGWNDLGSFESLIDVLPKDENGNIGDNLIVDEARNNLIISDKKTAVIDMHNTILVDTPDALLLLQVGSGQRVKNIVDQLKKKEPGLL